MTDKKIVIHQKTFSIEWGDMDALGHVNNSRYFDYFQQARIEWMESIKLDMKHSVGPVVVQVSCSYIKPIVYPATLNLKSSLQNQGRSSLVIEHEIYQGETLMTQGTAKVVWIDYEKKVSVPLPECIAKLFLA
jgi:acyl-CoA thioester hydrolase